MTTTPEPAPDFPPGRYGHRRDRAHHRRRRWISVALASLVALGGVAVAAKLYRQYTLAPYQVRILAITDLTDAQVTVSFEVRKPAGRGAVCTVMAHTRFGEEVGRAEVAVPAGASTDTTAQVTYTLTTTKRPVTAEVPGCGPTHQ